MNKADCRETACTAVTFCGDRFPQWRSSWGVEGGGGHTSKCWCEDNSGTED